MNANKEHSMYGFLQGFLAFILMLSLVSCHETEDGQTKGTLRLFATDAPFNFEGISSAKITIGEIKLRESGGKKVTVLSKDVTLDLLTLRNGLVETLSEVELPSGKYDEILLIVTSAEVEMKNGRVFPLKIPSGSESGLKIFVKPAIPVTTGVNTDVLLDFDLSRSFVPVMNGKELKSFNFRPVVRATILDITGTVSGQVLDVTDETPVGGATIVVKKGNDEIITAVSDADGYFKILGLPAGVYHIVAEADQFGSLTIDSVPVTTGKEVTTHFILTPVTLLE